MWVDKVVVIIVSIFGIAFTYWFFLLKKDEKTTIVSNDAITITVSGGYTPNIIAIPVGKKTLVSFFRKDPSTCLEEVVLPDFGIRKYLPLNKKVSIEITPKKKGTFEISCGMNMFHGKIQVV